MPEQKTVPDRRWLALVLLCAAQFMVVLDASIVNVALPSIKQDLGFSQDGQQWIISAYVLAFGGFLLLGGRLADLLGRRLIFMTGLVMFSTASFVAGLAESPEVLVVARAVQGLGGALLSPAALSIVTTMFTEGSERNKALGIWGAVAGMGGAAGVLLGGILTDALGWEWVFFAITPPGLLAAALAPTLIRESRSEGAARRFDVLGAVTVTAGLVAFVYALVDGRVAGWGSTQTIGLFAVAAVLFAAFYVVETRNSAPLVPFRIFRLRTLLGANVAGLLIGASLFSMFLFITLYLQDVLGYTPLEAGLAYLPLAVTIIVSAGVASQLVTRLGFKPVLLIGLGSVAVGLLWFSRVSADGTFAGDVLGPSLLAAFGLGFSFVPVTIAAVAGTESADAGLASGLINTSQQIGGALGLSILATIAFTRSGNELEALGRRPEPADVAAALTEGFQSAFLAGSGIAVLGIIATLVLVRTADSRAMRGQAAAVPVAA